MFTVAVDHSSSFPAQWTTTMEMTPDIKSGELLLRWQPLDHADVDLYRIRLSYADPLEPSTLIEREAEVGADSLIDGMVEGRIDNIDARTNLSGVNWCRQSGGQPHSVFTRRDPGDRTAGLSGYSRGSEHNPSRVRCAGGNRDRCRSFQQPAAANLAKGRQRIAPGWALC